MWFFKLPDYPVSPKLPLKYEKVMEKIKRNLLRRAKKRRMFGQMFVML